MSFEETKVTVKFYYPDQTVTEYLVTTSEAMELEILAITKPPKRLMKTIWRVGRDLLERGMEDQVGLELILGSSRSGDIYNALKYLEFKKVVERRKDVKSLTILSREGLKQVIDKIETLLKM